MVPRTIWGILFFEQERSHGNRGPQRVTAAFNDSDHHRRRVHRESGGLLTGVDRDNGPRRSAAHYVLHADFKGLGIDGLYLRGSNSRGRYYRYSPQCTGDAI